MHCGLEYRVFTLRRGRDAFPRALVLSEIQAASSMIWTWPAKSVFNDDNNHTMYRESIIQVR